MKRFKALENEYEIESICNCGFYISYKLKNNYNLYIVKKHLDKAGYFTIIFNEGLAVSDKEIPWICGGYQTTFSILTLDHDGFVIYDRANKLKIIRNILEIARLAEDLEKYQL